MLQALGQRYQTQYRVTETQLNTEELMAELSSDNEVLFREATEVVVAQSTIDLE